jgi:lysophospholipase L1-like esterase
MKKVIYLLICSGILSYGCSVERGVIDDFSESIVMETDPPENGSDIQSDYNILALGDSYTIGQSVCGTCRFPEQLKDSLKLKFDVDVSFGLKIFARTGWTTTNLINAISDEGIANKYDLATLLIGVNNQYQNKPFSIYQNEFLQLISIAVSKVNNNKTNLIVISIPDYAYTPFGNGDKNISEDIDKYNSYAENYCATNNITFINITDITRMGLDNPALVASDGLHPSELAYTKFVERLLPFAIEKLKE